MNNIQCYPIHTTTLYIITVYAHIFNRHNFEAFTVSFLFAKFYPQNFIDKSLTGTNWREGYT